MILLVTKSPHVQHWKHTGGVRSRTLSIT